MRLEYGLGAATGLCAFWLLSANAWAHDAPTTKLTWTREISRMVTQRCVGCHQPGGPAPFSLRTYAEARPWAVAIKEEVLQRRMPPWPAAKGFGEFSNDISLPQEEINRLAEWAEGGAPEGEPQYLRPVFAVPVWRPAPPPAGRAFRLQGKVPESLTLLAVRGAGKGKTWAELADGSIVPLAWLTGAGKARWLTYLEPIRLPSGTVIRGLPLDASVR
ncbi:MAG: c-type cytochrome [Bryobacteraceae bacterium]